MIKYLLSLFLLLIFLNSLFANDIAISNISVEAVNIDEQYAFIEFDIAGKNAWRITSGANNYNAVWVFAKYRINDGTWKHATLSTNDNEHISVDNLALDAQSDGMGVYFYYDVSESGNFTSYDLENLRLRWNFGENGLTGEETNIDVQVFGIEMVYVPQGSFYIGSGGGEHNHFYTHGSNSPYHITSEDAITVGENTGNLYYRNDQGEGEGGDRGSPIPADYPKGYNGFYIMQYEISQEQYVDFLNTLTRFQQDARVNASFTFPVSESGTVSRRNGIQLNSNGNGNPYTFFCNFDGDLTGNETNDGQNIPCSYLRWSDGVAYLDWAGLRPMTELEFEKACRGTATPVANEYAWGTTNLTQVTTPLNNSGTTSETTGSSGLGLCSYHTSDNGSFGPLRCGFAATTADIANKKQQSGASFYGVMELSGNLSESCVAVGSVAGRSFTATNGDGNVSNGTAWPNHEAYSDRGGNYVRNNTRLQVSNRSRATIGVNTKFSNTGWRGVRSVE